MTPEPQQTKRRFLGLGRKPKALDAVTHAEKAGWVDPTIWAQDAAEYALQQAAWPYRIAGGTAKNEVMQHNYLAYVQDGYSRSPIVFSAIDKRQQVFSQATFAFQRRVSGRPQSPFTTPDLALLEKPWPGGTTGELLSLMEYDGSLAGVAYWTTCDDNGKYGNASEGSFTRRMVRLRPDWVTTIIDSPSGDPWALNARVVAYSYQPKIQNTVGITRPDPLILLPDEVCRYVPKPDPIARFRGMSWITPLVFDVMGDMAATAHKLQFFRNGATPSLAVKFDKDLDPDLFDMYVAKFRDAHEGVGNAYKTLFLGGGADAVPLSVDLRQLDFAVTQGAGETRLAVVSGVPAAILGIGAGLGGSSLNDGNLRAVKRVFVQSTIQDLWNKVGPALETIIKPPGNSRLIADTRDIPFLQDDATDQAQVRQFDSATIVALVNGGFKADAAVAFTQTNDLATLAGQHTGLVSVQLQKPGEKKPPAEPPAPGEETANPGGNPESGGNSGK